MLQEIDKEAHLVEYQKSAILIAHFADGLQVSLNRWNASKSCATDCLCNERRNCIRTERLKCVFQLLLKSQDVLSVCLSIFFRSVRITRIDKRDVA